MEQMTKDSILYMKHIKYFEKYGYNEKSVDRWIKTENIIVLLDFVITLFILFIYLISVR